ncbi:tellurite resistance/C4-dicarboxylate transporter family protein [Corynebacterium ammoniagenes]|uniref:Tellurite resistance protein permease n=2 Tax=Corynebacterium ammoniagenes TaxID=1697 RepID=A0AAV5G3J7_CORAM|nr:tellurite resistance/C4-dicarboxylate transporter family protein [Corynebacterium ammoniagenes]AQS72670.1 tellurite resistance protein permease [Corynebacterium ammoniagenes]EFG81870.1 C4-dicarboxylate transporter/malic acid transport protein [Corynebacterium ammoniagenes DSM 20306]GJN43679.1 tellurite resistance protein permease [Corynebacterium ammoniagenes]
MSEHVQAGIAKEADAGIKSVLSSALERLSPGYFALVMATGIVSVGLYLVGFMRLSTVLLWITAAAYVVLWGLYIWRAVRHRQAMRRDLRGPEMAFAYFTVVAGTGVLAVRLLHSGYAGLAIPLVLFAAVLWFIFGYVLPWQVFMTRDGKPILSRTNGSWFIWAVASQSVALGLANAQPFLPGDGRWVGILTVLSWSVGVALYAGIAILVLLRVIHYGITAREFEPPYWVAMGALAIAVVAGTNIVNMESTPMVEATRTLIEGTIVVFWSFCLWLIPMLVGAGVWRHFIRKIPLAYTPTLWSMVFPIGMFSVASVTLGRVDSLPTVEALGEVAVWIAVAVWAIVFIAMLRHFVLLFIRTGREHAWRRDLQQVDTH